MNCDEPLYVDGEGYSYRDCTLELCHPGSHQDSAGRRYARPLPSGDAEEALSFISDLPVAAKLWDLDEREFYIKFSVTNVYMVKVSAESEDAALKQYSDYCDFPDFSRESPIDGGVEIERPDVHDRSMLTGAPIGPQIACPDCGAVEMRREWFHNPYRKCHGPIEWRETNAAKLQWRYRREFKATPAFDAARKQVAA